MFLHFSEYQKSWGASYYKKHNRAMEPVNSRLLYLISKSGLKKKYFMQCRSCCRKK